MNASSSPARERLAILAAILVPILLMTLWAIPTYGGGPRAVNGLGVPMLWDTSSPVLYNPDQGMLGTLSNTTADNMLASAFVRWDAVALAAIAFPPSIAELPVDVDAAGSPATNPAHWAHYWRVEGDGYSPVIYDFDGSVIDDMFGVGARFDVLGAAGLDGPITVAGTITEASIVINGAFFDGIAPPLSPEDAPSPLAFEAIMVHEVGHFANLDHSVVNHELAADGDPDNDIYLPTMYPLVVEDEAAIVTLNPDDEVALATLYPAPGFDGSTARIFGRIRDDGVPFQGANVVVRRRSGKAPPTDRLMFAYSGISGARHFPCNPGGSCAPGTPPDLAGEFAVAGLAGGNYEVCVEQIDRRLSVANGTFIGPLATPALLPGPEECYMASTESEDGAVDDPDDADLIPLSAGANLGPFDIHLNDLPASDPFEPNNTLGTPAVLPDLVAGADTSGALVGAGDLDFYQIPVTPGDIVRIDIDAAEIGSALDPIIGLYDHTNTLVGVIDDSVDPASGGLTLDPADSFNVELSGTMKLVVSSYPDFDLNGVGGATTGPYWIRVSVDHDADGDRVVDRHDTCPFDPDDDADDDGRCESIDNCDTIYNPTQTDGDADGVGLACDNCNPTTFQTLFDFETGAAGWTHRSLGANDTWHVAGTTCFGAALPSQMFVSNGNYGFGCLENIGSEHSQLRSPIIILPTSGTSTLMFDVLSFDEAGRCLSSGDVDAKDLGVSLDGGNTYTVLNNCTALADGTGAVATRTFDLTPFNGMAVQIVFVYNTLDSLFGHTFAVDNVRVTSTPNSSNAGQQDSDGDGVGNPCDLCPLDPMGDADGDGDCAGADNCPTLFNPQQDGGARVRLSPAGAGPYPSSPSIFSPDGSRVHWLADPNSVGLRQALMTAPSAGGAAVQLNPSLSASGQVLQFEASGDGTRVVYLANQDPNVNEIFSVPVTGGSATKLNGTLVSGGNVAAFAISRNSARVVYMANQESAARYDLYSVPLAGGTVRKLDGTLVAGGNVEEFVVSPDSQRVVFRADKDSDEFAELYSVPIGGGAITKLSDDPLVGPVLNGVRISPDSSRALYKRVPGGTDTDIFSVPIAGGAVVNLDALRATDGDVGSTQFSADGARIVYRSGPGLDGVQEISSVAITGGAVTQVNPTLAAGRTIIQFAISADGSRVVYSANQDVAGLFELYSVQIDGTGFTKLNSPLIDGGEGVMSFAISPDGARVVFKAEVEDSNPGLYSVPIAGGAVTQLDGALSVFEGTVIEISPDGATVAILPGTGTPDLYSVPIAGGTLVKVNGSLASGSVEDYHISPDSRRLLYIADQDPDAGNELYTTVLVTDPDADGITSFCDICPSVSDPMQSDGNDFDGVGEACDNCPGLENPGQEDAETAAGPDMTCLTSDDRGNLFGPDATCGTPDDLIGDGVGDACVVWADASGDPFTEVTSRTGAAWGDYDGDGDPDLFVARVGGSQSLLRNDAGAFVEVAGLPPGGLTVPRGAAWADHDNDGDPDLYVSDANGASRLFRNEGMGNFVDATAGPLADPGFGYGAAWADYDNDGDLDLFHAKVDGTNKLFRNQGGGVFVDATAAPITDSGQGRGVTWGDYDNDGDQDIYLVKSGAPNKLYRNEGDGTFVDATSPPLNLNAAGRGAAWSDYDNDGDLDLYVVVIGSSNKLFRNEGGGSFADVTSGPLGDTGTGTGLAWGDYDNDGDLDLYLANQGGVSRLFRNQGGTFTDATSGPLGSTRTHFCAAWADYDEDGDLDLFASDAGADGSRLFRNDSPHVNHWLHIDLIGRGSNRSAIGARVEAVTAVGTQIREVSGGHGPGCQDSLTVEFGFGATAGLEELVIRWPSGIVQTLTDVALDRRIEVVEPEFTPPAVTAVFPMDNEIDAALSTNVILVMSEPVNPLTATEASVFLTRNGLKISGTVHVSTDGHLVVFDPTGPLQVDSDYVVSVNGLLRDLLGNPAAAFTSTFDTTSNATSGSLPAEEVGEGSSGAIVPGTNANDQSGFSNAAVGDVNGDGLADLVVGAPNSDAGGPVDAGKVTMVFGSMGLQSNATVLETIEYRGEAAGDRAGTSVSPAGDINGDGLADFLIGAPFASPHGAASGKVYLVLGHSNLDELAPASLSLASLAACSMPTLCGRVWSGEAAGDKAGASVAFGDDINNDGQGDLLIGAPGASPAARAGAGKVYVVHGPTSFLPGSADLSSISSGNGSGGVVFHGESEGDRAGESVSGWKQTIGDMIDDLIIGAPGADTTDEFGAPIPDAGYVYAIHGGPANLVSSPPGGAIIELSRVANGLPDQVDGVVFLGLEPGGEIGRSVSGTADVDDDGVPDIVFGANQVAWVIPGDGPKTQSSQSDAEQEPPPTPTGLARTQADTDAHSQFGAWFYSAGTQGDLGGLTVGGAGDVNADGVDDLVIGAGSADVAGKVDAGKAYIVYGSKIRPPREVHLSDVGGTVPGLVVQGFEAGDDLGRSVGGGLDLNADGVADALVGAPFADARSSTPANAGETYVISPISPDEVVLVVASQAGPVTTLEWTAPPGAIAYNVYRGDLDQLLRTAGGVFTSDMVKLACDIVTDADGDGLPDTTTSVSPPVGQGHYFLVTAENLTGEGPLGPPSQQPPRVNDSQCP